MNLSPSEFCQNISNNSYYNNPSNTPDQSSIKDNLELLPAFLTYAIIGGIASIFNIICILTFLTNKELRKRYMFFALLTFGNLINTLFMFLAGTLRRHMIYTNQFLQKRLAFECLKLPTPHMQIFGGQLPAVVILLINIERVIAVYAPMFYKFNVTQRTRVYAVIGCLVTVLISQLVGYLNSYWSTYCSNYFCSITSAFGTKYCLYHTFLVILLPFLALIFNFFAYIGAKSKLNDVAKMKKELKKILVALTITFVDVLLIACPNVVVLGTFYEILLVTNAKVAYLYVLFCGNSITDLFIYIILKRDFRNHFLMCISFGLLKPYLEEKKEGNRQGQAEPNPVEASPAAHTDTNNQKV